jgi:hypothetical protein
MTIRELMRRLAAASPEDRRRIIHAMNCRDLLRIDAEFEAFAHEAQLPPGGDGWRVWLLMAGRGFGKTRAGAEWIDGVARSRPKARIALVGATIADARAVMVEGVSGLLAVAANRKRKVKWEPSLGRLTWPNGSQAQLFSGDHADGLRGPEHDFAWGVGIDRFPGCRLRGRTAEIRPSPVSRPGKLLHCRLYSNGRMERAERLFGVFHDRRVEVHLSGRRP